MTLLLKVLRDSGFLQLNTLPSLVRGLRRMFQGGSVPQAETWRMKKGQKCLFLLRKVPDSLDSLAHISLAVISTCDHLYQQGRLVAFIQAAWSQLKFLLLWRKIKGTRAPLWLSQEVRINNTKIRLQLNDHLVDHQALIMVLALRLRFYNL